MNQLDLLPPMPAPDELEQLAMEAAAAGWNHSLRLSAALKWLAYRAMCHSQLLNSHPELVVKLADVSPPDLVSVFLLASWWLEHGEEASRDNAP